MCPLVLIKYSHASNTQNSKIFNLITDDRDCFSYTFFYIYNLYLMIDINGIALGQSWTYRPMYIELLIRSLSTSDF